MTVEQLGAFVAHSNAPPPHLRETRRGANPGSGIRRLLLRPFTAWEVDAALTAAGLPA